MKIKRTKRVQARLAEDMNGTREIVAISKLKAILSDVNQVGPSLSISTTSDYLVNILVTCADITERTMSERPELSRDLSDALFNLDRGMSLTHILEKTYDILGVHGMRQSIMVADLLVDFLFWRRYSKPQLNSKVNV